MFQYKTKVRVNREVLSAEIAKLKESYDEIGNRDTKEGRSRFSKWNNLNKFYERTFNPFLGNKEYAIVDVIGEAKGATSRVYYKPSVTSLTKEIRKAIEPINGDNRFVFFDLASAEFVLNAYFAGEVELLKDYKDGKDVYMGLSHMFPSNTPRNIVKTILIANMYNTTAYRCSQQLGITENQATTLLRNVACQNAKMTALKDRIVDNATKLNGYYAPNVFTGELVRISDIDVKKGFNPDLALSCYTQSALGLIMQEFIRRCSKACVGTLLTVFDSVLIELEPDRVEKYKEFATEFFNLFRIDEFGDGKTFWESAGY